MKAIASIERNIDFGLALILPALIAVSCFLPLLGLALGSAPYWVSPTIILIVAVSSSTYLLATRGTVRAIPLALASAAAGTALFAAFTRGVNALGSSQDQSIIDIASLVVSAVPFLVAVVATAAFALTMHALPGKRLALGIAWLIAIATPFVLFAPVSALSVKAGNAGMDAVGLLVMPLAALMIWSFIVLGSALLSRARPQPEGA